MTILYISAKNYPRYHVGQILLNIDIIRFNMADRLGPEDH